MGRLFLTPKIFDVLREQKPGAGGEIQLTDAIATLGEFEEIYAYNFKGKRYDVGEKIGFIQTTIELALQREDLKTDLLKFLHNVINKEVTHNKHL